MATLTSRWILVADASRARLYAEHSGTLNLLEAFEHPESREKARNLTSDANGRKPAGPAFRSVQPHGATPGGYGRPGAEPDADPKRVEAQKFARELIGYLHGCLAEHRFGTLIVTAPPAFLGMLRSTMDPELEKHVQAFVNKDLTHYTDREVKQHLERSLTT